MIRALRAAVSFRVAVALVTSSSVTAAVAGPMAYQAAQARSSTAAAAEAAPGSTVAPVPVPVPVPGSPPEPAASAPTTTISTTSTTVAPPAPSDGPTSTAADRPLEATGLFISVQADHAARIPLD